MFGAIDKLKRFSERNGGSFLHALVRRYLGNLYTYSAVRKLSAILIAIRKPKKWVFLIGCYNSGTTICRDILGAHPDISALPREGVRFTSHLPRPEDKGWNRMWICCPEYMQMPIQSQNQIAAQIIKDWSPWWSKKTEVFLEKSITNITRMKWLDDNFDNAYFIGITRNAYPVIEGIRRRAAPKGNAINALGSYQYPLSLIAKQWVDANTRLLKGRVAINKYYEIKYEDLVSNPLDTLNRIWNFLEVSPIDTSFESNILNIGKRKFKLINMNGVSLERISKKDVEIINPVIKHMQEKLGYKLINTSEFN